MTILMNHYLMSSGREAYEDCLGYPYIETQQQTNNVEILPIHLAHILALETLSLHHKDPFDRVLIAQANVEGAILLSCDPIFSNYPVNVVW